MLIMLMPRASSKELQNHLNDFLTSPADYALTDEDEVHAMLPEILTHKNRSGEPIRIIIACDLDPMGTNHDLTKMLKIITGKVPAFFRDSWAMLVLKSPNEWYTKSFASWLVFLLNHWGCRFIGHPLVEMTKDLNNVSQWERTTGLSRHQLIRQIGQRTVHRLLTAENQFHKRPKLAVLHASSRETSNTLMLWHMIHQHLKGMEVSEHHVHNATVVDCIGCPYQTCLYYGQQQSCYYNQDVVHQLLPVIEKANVLVWVCPNYNDAISANLMAVINRMTALYRAQSFYDKKIFAVIVSGNSGGDSVARQLIDALCLNKGIMLPPSFSITATAYQPGSILEVDRIEKKAAMFAAQIEEECVANASAHDL